MTQQLITRIYAVFAKAQKEDEHLPQPVDIQITDDQIALTFVGDIDGIGVVASGLLQEAKINYDDPRPGTNDIHTAISKGGRGTNIKHVVMINRFSEADYDAALKEATDPDGDGVAHFEQPTAVGS